MFMKILITEVEFQVLISDYLDRMFKKSKRNTGSLDDVNYIWFTDTDDKPSLIWNSTNVDNQLFLGVRRDLWKQIQNIFSTSDEDTNQVIKDWFKKRGKKLPNEVYIF